MIIVQERLLDYRVEFFDALRKDLRRRGIDLELLHSDATGGEVDKSDGGHLRWSKHVPMTFLRWGGRHLDWQQVLWATRHADGVIVEQASRHLAMYPMILRGVLRGPRVAWWGHGRDRQTDHRPLSRLAERVKSALAGSVDWFFAYTKKCADDFVAVGGAQGRCTVVNNSVDTSWARDLPQPGPAATYVAAYLGSLHQAKDVPELMAVVDEIARRLPAFRFKILGDGPLRDEVAAWASTRSYVEFCGRVRGPAKAEALSDVGVLLNPGMVGLVAVESLASGRPLVTRATRAHSPEFEYLAPGRTAVVTAGGTTEEFVRECVALIEDPVRIQAMAVNAREAARRVTMNSMVENYGDGVQRWLDTPSRRSPASARSRSATAATIGPNIQGPSGCHSSDQLKESTRGRHS